VVKVTNLIAYPGLGSDKKLKLTTKLDVEATVLKTKSFFKKPLKGRRLRSHN
jgi:hypothetical protein